MRVLLILCLFFCFCRVDCVFASDVRNEGVVGGKHKNMLIAYFSWSGNTQYIAEKIHSRIGGDILSIETKVPYPDDYHEVAYGIAKKQYEENILPALKNNGDVAKYDVIFVGTPVWWYDMAPAVKTFLTHNNFEGKIVVPFISHGGGGTYTIEKDMATIATGATVLPALIVQGRGYADIGNSIDNWLEKIFQEE